jgi:hypothetical protein
MKMYVVLPTAETLGDCRRYGRASMRRSGQCLSVQTLQPVPMGWSWLVHAVIMRFWPWRVLMSSVVWVRLWWRRADGAAFSGPGLADSRAWISARHIER